MHSNSSFRKQRSCNHDVGGIKWLYRCHSSRGGKSLVAEVERSAKVPVFGHLEGICHIYVDEEADIDKALSICLNAKMRRTGICGAVETILINKEITSSFVPKTCSLSI